MAKPHKLPNGTWRIRWKDEQGKRISETYGTYGEANAQLKINLAQVEEIERGVRSAVPIDRSFNQLCDYWIEKKLPQKRTGSSDESIIRKHFRPALGNLLIRLIGVEHTDKYQAERTILNKKTVANHLTLLISMLNTAVELGWLLKAPRIKKPKTELFSSEYRFLRSAEEIRRFLLAAHEEGEEVYSLYATAVYTGARQGELASLEKSDINFDTRLITIQRSFEGPTKAGYVRYVPILDSLLPILREWVLRTSGPLLFPNEAGNMHQPSARIFQETLHRILGRAGFPKLQYKGKPRHYIRFHDLRHSFASHWMMNGGDLFRLQKILGHRSAQMTQRYAHLAPDAFASDYSRMGTHEPVRAGTVLSISAQK